MSFYLGTFLNKTEKSFSLIGCAKHGKLITSTSWAQLGPAAATAAATVAATAAAFDEKLKRAKTKKKQKKQKRKRKLHGDEAAQAAELCSLKIIKKCQH